MIKGFTLKNLFYDLLRMKTYLLLILNFRRVVKTNLVLMKTYVVKQMAMALRWPRQRVNTFSNDQIKNINLTAFVKIILQNQNVQNLRNCASKVDYEKKNNLRDEP